MVKVQVIKLTTAPKEKCPKCESENVVWCEVGGLGIGFYRCKDCGEEGW